MASPSPRRSSVRERLRREPGGVGSLRGPGDDGAGLNAAVGLGTHTHGGGGGCVPTREALSLHHGQEEGGEAHWRASRHPRLEARLRLHSVPSSARCLGALALAVLEQRHSGSAVDEPGACCCTDASGGCGVAQAVRRQAASGGRHGRHGRHGVAAGWRAAEGGRAGGGGGGGRPSVVAVASPRLLFAGELAG
jgi:hypothetical protein